jgi:hypothetical protein
MGEVVNGPANVDLATVAPRAIESEQAQPAEETATL